jgi:hypothetical protein
MAQLKEKNDVKIFILYLMRNVGYPLDFSTLNDIVLLDGIVNYFDFAECFAELISSKNIEEQVQGEEKLYAITEQGKNVCDSLQSDLMQLIREKSLKSAIRFLDFKKKGIKSSCSFETLPDGKYIFNCKLTEQKEEIMNVSLTVDNKKVLDRMRHTFGERPEVVYRGLLSILTGEINYLL